MQAVSNNVGLAFVLATVILSAIFLVV